MGSGAEDTYGNDERLPWLETVEEDYEEPRRGRVFLLVFLALVVLGAVAAALYWQRNHGAGTGSGALIQAPEGDYKVRPENPGGMKVDGEGDTIFRTSQGAVSNSSINVAALPEAPVDAKPAARPSAAPKNASKSATIALPTTSGPLAAKPAARTLPVIQPPAAGAGSLVQLGAFPSEGAANIAWVRLSKRFAYLAPLGKSVERFVTPDGKTVYRLRVNAGSNGQARELCGKLKVAGERCFVAS